MADEKMNTVGTKKAMLVWLLSNKACMACTVKLAFSNEFQIDHIEAQQTFIDNGMAIDTTISNLAALCKTCNSEKQNKGIEFYADKNTQAYKFILAFRNVSKGITDIRNLMKKPVRNVAGKVVTKQVLDAYCDAYAQKYSSSKFAKIHRQGKFYKTATA